MSLRKRDPSDGVGGSGRLAGSPEAPEERVPGGYLSLLPWDRFSAWLHCVCVVGFDLELGQAVEVSGGASRQPLEPGPLALARRRRASAEHDLGPWLGPGAG